MIFNPHEISYHASKEIEEIVMGLSQESDDPFEILSALEEEIGISLIDLQFEATLYMGDDMK